ncbi:serine--tRNA ligase [Candidatus Woesearchaeota archaeon]|nr:serine--tRNA ligase [Candidatus Woesearchaeota archaeon]
MFDINLIRENPELVKNNLERRKDPEKTKLLDEVIKMDSEWRKLKKQNDDLRCERNKISEQINKAKKEGKDAKAILKKAKEIPEQIKTAEARQKELETRIRMLLFKIPNMMHESVPYGKDESENVEVKKWGKPRKFDFPLKSHAEIAEQLGIVDFDRSTKVSGVGFYYLKGELALLNQALIRFAIDHLVKKGYTYIEPPLMLKRKAYEGMVSLEDFENVMYKIEGEDAFMIATAEHPLGAMYMDETLTEEELPLKYVGFSINFRKEIGTHSVDEKGLFRTHQFNKVEQFIFCKPEDSWKLHEELQKNSEELYTALELPWRAVNICTGDLGIIAAKKYDIELWMPRQNQYREVGSNSNCTDYQARRLNLKCTDKHGNRRYLHTLNNTAIATSRTMVAILENNQNKDGTITVPKALLPYMNGIKAIGKKK